MKKRVLRAGRRNRIAEDNAGRASCNKALWLDRDRVMAMGGTEDVVAAYEAHVAHMARS